MEKHQSVNVITVLYKVQNLPALPTPNLLTQFPSKANSTSTYGYFFKGKAVTPLSQLTAMPPFPTPHILVQFVSKAHTDYKKGQTDAQYETRLALAEGWKLVTTASDSRWNNGYCGAACWHPEHQQVVIAHRGTEPTNQDPCGQTYLVWCLNTMFHRSVLPAHLHITLLKCCKEVNQ
jgi:hypothetical protein